MTSEYPVQNGVFYTEMEDVVDVLPRNIWRLG